MLEFDQPLLWPERRAWRRSASARAISSSRPSAGSASARPNVTEWFALAVASTVIRAKGLTDEPEQRVTGQMALTVVDLLEAVYVDEREHERGAGAMCALELARNLLEPQPANPAAGQLVRRREPQLACRLRPVPHRLSAFTGCLLAVGGCPGPVVCCLGPIGSRPRPIACGPQQDVLPARIRVVLKIVQTSELITTLRATITKGSLLITLLRRSQPRRRTLVAHFGHEGTFASRSLARQSASVIRHPVATGGEIIVGSVLILIRTSLIARARTLVVIRPCLILITCRLVVVRPCLIPVTPRLTAIRRRVITDSADATRQQFGSTRRTARNRACFAAGRAPHNLGHSLVLSPSELRPIVAADRQPTR